MAQSFALLPATCAKDLIALLHVIIIGLIRLAIPITVIMIIWAAILYITSRGQGIEKATKAVIWAATGFGLLLISSGIISVIEDFFGVKTIGLTAGGTTGCGSSPITGQGPTTLAGVLKILTDASGWLFTFAIIAGVAMIIVAGINYMFARGDTTKASKALKVLIYAIIGLAIAALAWAIINIVANFLTGKPIFATVIGQAYAASTPITASRPVNAPTNGPSTIQDIYKILQVAVGWLFIFALIAGVGIIIVAGIMYIFAGGNAIASRTATKAVIFAVVGIAVAALAWAIVNLVGNFFVAKNLLGGSSTSTSGDYKCVGGLNNGNTYASNDLCQAQCPANGGTCTPY